MVKRVESNGMRFTRKVDRNWLYVGWNEEVIEVASFTSYHTLLSGHENAFSLTWADITPQSAHLAEATPLRSP